MDDLGKVVVMWMWSSRNQRRYIGREVVVRTLGEVETEGMERSKMGFVNARHRHEVALWRIEGA